MARLPNTATKAEREELHKAKMAGKVYDRARRAESFRFDFYGCSLSRSRIKRMFGYSSIARANRHTGEPHQHAREIARRQRRAERTGG
jgi:hypothetical protein